LLRAMQVFFGVLLADGSTQIVVAFMSIFHRSPINLITSNYHTPGINL
jgi:hypothetical protein